MAQVTSPHVRLEMHTSSLLGHVQLPMGHSAQSLPHMLMSNRSIHTLYKGKITAPVFRSYVGRNIL